MPLVVPNEGEVLLLRYCLNMTATADAILHLYATNVSLSEGLILSGISTSEPATVAGYTQKALAGAGWTISVGGSTTAEYTAQTFSMTTGVTLYGYYVTNAANNTLLWAETFSGGPFTLPATGGVIVVTPKLSAD